MDGDVVGAARDGRVPAGAAGAHEQQHLHLQQLQQQLQQPSSPELAAASPQTQAKRAQSPTARAFSLLPRSSSLATSRAGRRRAAATVPAGRKRRQAIGGLDALEAASERQNSSQDEPLDVRVEPPPPSDSSASTSGLALLSSSERREIPRPPRRSGLPEVAVGDEGDAAAGPQTGDRCPTPGCWPTRPEHQEEGRDVRNSYFAGWLVACSLFVVLLNVFAVVLVQLTYRPQRAQDDPSRGGSAGTGSSCS
ncbi:transient receptor potential Ca2 channel (TRP-CC) family protein [Phytophthora cinnamomi]|uniref:transient receptor potential Ca2 channel (TRP-CC) family protein n=1 Tax=Phytophthora cinnamomi TaxID=4785 RepID=UPI003559892E|nr:transient receptor potential Ca2 channel (TRP-CC) family protein [Phytophthora cinnamomi]